MYQSQYQRPAGGESAMLRAHCQLFSRMGWALFAQMLAMLATQSFVLAVVLVYAPELAQNSIFLWCLSVGSAYGVGVPVFCILIQTLPMPQPTTARKPLGAARLLQVYAIALGGMYLINYGTLLLMYLVSLVRGEAVINPVDSITSYPLALSGLLGCVVAPVLEELVFRHLLLRRLRPYGDRFALIASAVAFALFHGNLYQFFYTFAVGLVFGYVMLRTNCLWQTILLHAMINAIATVAIPLLLPLGETVNMVLGAIVLISVVLGITFFIVLRRRIFFLPGKYGFTQGRSWRLFFENPGMLCFVVLALLLACSQLAVTQAAQI